MDGPTSPTPLWQRRQVPCCAGVHPAFKKEGWAATRASPACRPPLCVQFGYTATASGTAAAAEGSLEGSPAAPAQPYKKGKRGPKPKYIFATQVRAAAGSAWWGGKGGGGGLSSSAPSFTQ